MPFLVFPRACRPFCTSPQPVFEPPFRGRSARLCAPRIGSTVWGVAAARSLVTMADCIGCEGGVGGVGCGCVGVGVGVGGVAAGNAGVCPGWATITTRTLFPIRRRRRRHCTTRPRTADSSFRCSTMTFAPGNTVTLAHIYRISRPFTAPHQRIMPLFLRRPCTAHTGKSMGFAKSSPRGSPTLRTHREPWRKSVMRIGESNHSNRR